MTRIRVDEVDMAGEGTGYSGSLLCQPQLQNHPQTARGHPEDGWAAVNEDSSSATPSPPQSLCPQPAYWVLVAWGSLLRQHTLPSYRVGARIL